jgi:hypothetical protein
MGTGWRRQHFCGRPGHRGHSVSLWNTLMASAKRKSKPKAKAKKHHVLADVKREDASHVSGVKEPHVIVAVEKSAWERIKAFMGW